MKKLDFSMINSDFLSLRWLKKLGQFSSAVLLNWHTPVTCIIEDLNSQHWPCDSLL